MEKTCPFRSNVGGAISCSTLCGLFDEESEGCSIKITAESLEAIADEGVEIYTVGGSDIKIDCSDLELPEPVIMNSKLDISMLLKVGFIGLSLGVIIGSIFKKDKVLSTMRDIGSFIN